jgi:tetratricopeptide (TPR) repeat protein
MLRIAFTLLTALPFLVGSVAAYEAGDIVVVMKPTAIHVEKAAPDKLWPGLVLRVEATRQQWLWVASARAGWLDPADVVKLADAVSHFSKRVTQNPKDAEAWLARGLVQHYQGDFAKALADIQYALTLSPSALAYRSRGLTYYAQKELDKALADYEQALKLDPKDVVALNNRANVWIDKGDYARALADFEAALGIEAEDVLTHNNLAWLKATCPDAKFRDGKKAIELATKACELARWRDAQGLDTLAAAHAEAGQFEKSIEAEERAIELATAQEKPQLEQRLKLYEAKQPYREEASALKSGTVDNDANATKAP